MRNVFFHGHVPLLIAVALVFLQFLPTFRAQLMATPMGRRPSFFVRRRVVRVPFMAAGPMPAMATLSTVTTVTCPAPPAAKRQEKKASAQEHPDQPTVFRPHFPFLLFNPLTYGPNI
jgi:hypothetical protein